MSQTKAELLDGKSATVNLKNPATADNSTMNLVLQTGETDIAGDDVIGKIAFQAPDEGTGTDAVLVAAAIQARSETDFSSSANATSLDFMTGASEAAAKQWSLLSTGHWLPAATDHGIYLGVTAATAANLLDDYEEGSWTPVLGSTGSYSGQGYDAQVGSYTKIGRQVTLHMQIILNDAGTVGDFSTIFGLPFTPVAASEGSIPISVWKITLTSGHTPTAIFYTGGSARIYLQQQDGAGTLDQIAASGVADDARLYMTATFLV